MSDSLKMIIIVVFMVSFGVYYYIQDKKEAERQAQIKNSGQGTQLTSQEAEKKKKLARLQSGSAYQKMMQRLDSATLNQMIMAGMDINKPQKGVSQEWPPIFELVDSASCSAKSRMNHGAMIQVMKNTGLDTNAKWRGLSVLEYFWTPNDLPKSKNVQINCNYLFQMLVKIGYPLSNELGFQYLLKQNSKHYANEIAFLRSRNFNFNHTNFKGDNYLHRLIQTPKSNQILFKQLIEQGVDPSHKNDLGNTPLMTSVLEFKKDPNRVELRSIIKLLVQNGANPRLPNNANQSPMLVADSPTRTLMAKEYRKRVPGQRGLVDPVTSFVAPTLNPEDYRRTPIDRLYRRVLKEKRIEDVALPAKTYKWAARFEKHNKKSLVYNKNTKRACRNQYKVSTVSFDHKKIADRFVLYTAQCGNVVNQKLYRKNSKSGNYKTVFSFRPCGSAANTGTMIKYILDLNRDGRAEFYGSNACGKKVVKSINRLERNAFAPILSNL